MKTLLRPFLILSLASSLTHSAAPQPIQAGFAERDISPEIGMERPGGYVKNFHRQFHDPCKARVAVFDSGESQVALIGLDALLIRRPQVLAIRKAITEKTGIPADHILIAASHSHSSGPTGMILPGEFDHADDFVQKLAYEKSSNADAAYLDTLVNETVAGTVDAWESRAPINLGFGAGSEDSVSFNRRFRMKDGLTFTHPRPGNPNIVEPAGPIDPEVGVIGAWNEEGNLAGCIVTFACHATAGPPGISANYPYYIERAIRGVFGEETVLVFLAGASADITQVNNLTPYRRPTGTEAQLTVGASVGAEAVRVLVANDLAKTNQATLAASNKILKIPRRKPSTEHLDAARKLVAQPPLGKSNMADWTFAKETVLLQALIESEPVRDVEVQTLQIGPAVFVTTPAEYFTQFGLDQKDASGFPFTWPVCLANGLVGYVPTEEAFGPHGGGYETRLTADSPLIPSAGRTLADTGIQLIQSLQPDPLPELAPAPPYKPNSAWPYGNLPPQLD
jgi:neutral ceramidase